MSFGTGTHHSTKMCIEELEKIIKPGDEVLDIGCGSGILSIVSLLLGAKDATALDIDPNCVHIAYEKRRFKRNLRG
ncbi:MAG: 50S ribosomal protein L11 methyltransferase [Clostridiales bacterium]|nr:MAG: 50S ribosomal protein L11 methyltransferase [Clostridiales bacterium]